MKKIKNFGQFNEGKISQFFLKSIMRIVSNIKVMVKKLKGNYFPLPFKDKKLDKSLQNRAIQLLDYYFFDGIKMLISKKVKEDMISTSFTQYIKLKTGVDLYDLCSSILSDLNEDAIDWSSDESVKQKQKEALDNSIQVIKKIESVIKKLDDELLDEKQFKRQLADLHALMQRIKDNSHEDIDDLNDDIQNVQQTLKSGKTLDELLDKIHRFGMDSLTEKEKRDLMRLSRESDS